MSLDQTLYVSNIEYNEFVTLFDDDNWNEDLQDKHILFETHLCKFNALHKFVEENVLDGRATNCEHIDITEYFVQLFNTVETIHGALRSQGQLAFIEDYFNMGTDNQPQVAESNEWIDIAKNLFPTQSRFFFGSDDYDFNYALKVDKLHNVLHKINDLIQMNPDANLVYYSSW